MVALRAASVEAANRLSANGSSAACREKANARSVLAKVTCVQPHFAVGRLALLIFAAEGCGAFRSTN